MPRRVTPLPHSQVPQAIVNSGPGDVYYFRHFIMPSDAHLDSFERDPLAAHVSCTHCCICALIRTAATFSHHAGTFLDKHHEVAFC
jgi:hypothetical protein